MRHYIICKYHEDVGNRDMLFQEISTLFEGAKRISGVRSVELYPSVTDFPNRYDLMIILDMEDDALGNFDQSEVHFVWKRDYAKYIAAKAIFDSK